MFVYVNTNRLSSKTWPHWPDYATCILEEKTEETCPSQFTVPGCSERSKKERKTEEMGR